MCKDPCNLGKNGECLMADGSFARCPVKGVKNA